MINWKYVRSQYQATWVNVLLFGLVFAILIGVMNSGGLMGYKRIPASSPSGSIEFDGVSEMFNMFVFGVPALIIFLGFGISMNAILIHRDISRGYIISWLTTAISRNGLFNSKLFVLISATLVINLWMIIFELLTFGLMMEDFNEFVGYLLWGNFILIVYSLMIVAGTWMVYCLFQKHGLVLGILLGLGAWFLLCYVLGNMGETNENWKFLKYFKYFTIQSLFNSPLKYDKEEFFPSFSEGIIFKRFGYAYLLPLKALDYAWQLPLMGIVGSGLFIGGQMIVKQKDFAF